MSIEIQLIMIYLIYMTTECLLVLWRSIILDRSQVQSLAFYNGGAVSICCNYYICECFYYILLILSDNESVESVLQLKFDKNETVVLASTANGFAVWFLMPDEENQNIRGIFLSLPHSVRNITTRMLTSNSVMLSADGNYAIAGVR